MAGEIFVGRGAFGFVTAGEPNRSLQLIGHEQGRYTAQVTCTP
jgi:hypothetical protein